MLGASVGASPFYVPYPNAHESREQHGTSGCSDPHVLGVGARIGRECRSVRLVWLWPQSTTPLPAPNRFIEARAREPRLLGQGEKREDISVANITPPYQ